MVVLGAKQIGKHWSRSYLLVQMIRSLLSVDILSFNFLQHDVTLFNAFKIVKLFKEDSLLLVGGTIRTFLLAHHS